MATPSGLIRALHRGTFGQVTSLGHLPRRLPVCPAWDEPRTPAAAAIPPRAAGRPRACAERGARGGAGPALPPLREPRSPPAFPLFCLSFPLPGWFSLAPLSRRAFDSAGRSGSGREGGLSRQVLALWWSLKR